MLLSLPLSKGENKKEGGEAPLLKLLPPSLVREGGKGDRLLEMVNICYDKTSQE
jgi:hypothetical protein